MANPWKRPEITYSAKDLSGWVANNWRKRITCKGVFTDGFIGLMQDERLECAATVSPWKQVARPAALQLLRGFRLLGGGGRLWARRGTVALYGWVTTTAGVTDVDAAAVTITLPLVEVPADGSTLVIGGG